jgi:pyruvate,water dikinase
MSDPQTAASRGAPDDASLVLFFDEIAYAETSHVGGKGANLGELMRAGFPVPPGFCITTAAYAEAAAGANLAPLLAELAATDSATAAGHARSRDLATALRERLLGAVISARLVDTVRAAYQALGNGDPIAVAVRSSATAEDLPFASFAGQQDTYLNVIGADALFEAVRRCWASLWNDRAVSYRMANRVDPLGVCLAVVVQRMIPVAVAGVLFTANPLTGRRRQAVIDASPGLGEAVVSGAVNPDHFVVNTVSGKVVEQRLGDKRVVIEAAPGGGTRRVERAGQTTRACLSNEQARELARLGARVEAHYHAPQDTEWAIDTAGALWLTQARPITTLYPLPAEAPASDTILRVYFSFNVAQGVYQPLTPLGLALIRRIAAAGARLAGRDLGSHGGRPTFLVEAGMRLFVDLTGALRNPIGRRLLGFALAYGEARSAAAVQPLLGDPRLALRPGGRWRFVRGAIHFATRLRVPRYLLQAIIRPDATLLRVCGLRARLERRLTLSADASALERLDLAEHVAPNLLIQTLGSLGPILLVGLGCFGLAGKLLGHLATADERQTVLRSLPHNPTTEMDLALWRVAQHIAPDHDAAAHLRASSVDQLAQDYRHNALPPIAQRGLEGFLRTYGHRGIAEIDVGLPRWSDDPTHILGALVNYLRLGDPDLTPDVRFARGARQAEAMARELTARARRRGWLRGWLVGLALRRARAFVGMREAPKFHLVLIMARLREILQPVAEELTSTSRVARADDLYFLTFVEARAALAGTDMRAVVRERRATYERETQRRHVPRLLLSDGTEPREPTAGAVVGKDEVGALRGAPASAGSVTARARVILDPIGAQLEPGEILVAPSTDPGWTPLFLTAGGLVMEMGGSISHGAVVAREYGIPAVVGVAGATERIRTGYMITVDGSEGTVALLGEETATQGQLLP